MVTLFIICLAGFFAALVDSMVGGGGLISVPALLATGIPTHLALGTNKFASSTGAISSAYHYFKSGNLNKKMLIRLVPFSLIGSAIGVNVVLGLNPDFLKAMIIFLVAIIGIYTLVNKNLGLVDHYKEPSGLTYMKGRLVAILIGFYDGFFGPGTGSFLIFSLIKLFGFDFKKAAANGKVLNLASNLSALFLFLINGKVVLYYAVPMAISMMIGARVGTHLAVTKGSKFIKPIFVIVSFTLVAKMAVEMFV
ncbi:TSUP family transporter [Fusibacter sp. Q10-2]|uniref:Probable membrane transporter protein n=1 Tax=Fusibacter ferrireducens TaxID=2785058 RepID=A0ABR9ZTM7_9FIRM|nr:TSUP family transporter [Fusibacter ferrireducens]